MHWLQRLTSAYVDSEAPPKFFYWAGMAALSAVVRKNVWLNRFHYKLYPNIYVFIVAASGMKKGTPIKVARELLEGIDCTRIISGRNSIQEVLFDLSKPFNSSHKDTLPMKSASGFMLSGELAAFLTKDNDSLKILTDIHDTHAYEKEWKYSLRSGKARLQEPCLTLLGATNEEHFNEAVPKSDVGGGFIARTFIVYSGVPGNYNSLTRAPRNFVNLSSFLPYLEEVSKVKGEIAWTEPAIELYDAWYYPYVKSIDSDKTGTKRRLGDQVLKTAILISLSHDTDLVIKASHVEEAIRECKLCAACVDRVVQGTGTGIMSQPITIILRELLKKEDHCIGRQWFLQRFWKEGLSQPEFDVSIETFIGSGAVTVSGRDQKVIYTLKSSFVDEYGRQEQKLKDV